MTKKCIANGLTIAYQERGEGEPLILIMGLGAPGAKWEPHLQIYEKHFRSIAIDNRGSGKSDKPVMESYSIEDMAKDVVGVMDALKISSAHVNGISMGGAIAQYLAIHWPERVRSLILTSTFPRCNVSFRRSVEILRDACDRLDSVTFGRLVQWIIYGFQFQEEHEAFMLEEERKDLRAPDPMPSYAYKAQCRAILRHDTRPSLQAIKAPTLVASGDADLFVPEYLTMEMFNAIPNAQLYLCKGGGHVHHWEHLDDYNAETLAFLLAHRQDR